MLFREYDFAFIIKDIYALSKQTVRLGNPVRLASYKCAGRGLGIIVISVNQHQTVCNDNSVNTIIIVIGECIMIDSVRTTYKMIDNAVFVKAIIVSCG